MRPAVTQRTLPADHRTDQRERFSRHDLVAGASVALVVIPQSVALADLAGMPAHAGLHAAAVPAVVAAFVASSRYLQTGPVALTSLLTLGALSPLAATGSAQYVGLAAILALVVGLTRITLGLLRFGLLAYLMSQPLLLGFTSAAGVLIVLSQLPAALGVVGEPEGVLAGAFWTLRRPEAWRLGAFVFAVGTVALIRGGRRIHPLFPGFVLATVGGILLSMALDYPGPVLGAVPSGLALPSLALPWGSAPRLVLPGIVIGLVGFAEPASIARTYAAEDRDPWDPNREFVSQGLANLAAGVFGAFPVGGSFARTSVARLAGGRSQWTGAVAGLIVLLFLPFAQVLAPMPSAVLAGIIIAASMGLVRLRPLLRMWTLSIPQALVAWSTFAFTLALSPHLEQAVLLGILLSVGVHLWRELPVSFDTWVERRTVHLAPKGVLWFGSAPAVEEAVLSVLARHKEADSLVVHMEGVGRVDLTGARTLQTLLEEAESAGLQTRLEGVPIHAHRILGTVLDWHPVREPREEEGSSRARGEGREGDGGRRGRGDGAGGPRRPARPARGEAPDPAAAAPVRGGEAANGE